MNFSPSDILNELDETPIPDFDVDQVPDVDTDTDEDES